MQDRKVITLASINDLWNSLVPDFSTGTAISNYHIAIEIEGQQILVDISKSPGGNVEGGYESSSIRAVLPADKGFEFIIYPEDFISRIGKVFGMQDVVLGYPEFDNNLIVKTTQPEKLKSLFTSPDTREVLQNLSGFAFKIEQEDEGNILEFNIQRALINLNELKIILELFYSTLNSLQLH